MSRGHRRLAVVGAGRLARAVAPVLAALPSSAVVVWGRGDRGRRAWRRAGVRYTTRLETAARDADTVLVAVTDHAIEEVARRLAAIEVDWSERIVLHTSGILGPDRLRALSDRGAAVGVLHPFQTLGSAGARNLAGSFARIEGDRRAVGEARRVARALGLRPMRFARAPDERDRALYHTAASLASNDIAALLHAAADRLCAAGAHPEDAVRALAALASGVLRNLEVGGLEGTLTGPAVRGDVDALRRHLAALETGPAQAAHRALSTLLVGIARETGRVDAETAERVETALARGRGGRKRGARGVARRPVRK